MLVKLTFRQLQAARYWATERHLGYLAEATTKTGAAMPYTGWRSLSTLMQEQAYTKWGRGRYTKLAGTEGAGTMSAIKAVEKALARVDTHPALHGMAVTGCSYEVFCVWPIGDPMAQSPTTFDLKPYPTILPMMFLTPDFDDDAVVTSGDTTFRIAGGMTRWHLRAELPGPMRQPWIFDDVSHHVGW